MPILLPWSKPAGEAGRLQRAVRGVAVGSLAATAVGELLGRRALVAVPRLSLMLSVAGQTLLNGRDTTARTPVPLLTGLAFAAAGDTVMAAGDSSRTTLAGIGLFTGTHASYLYGYLKGGALQRATARPLPAAGFLACYLISVRQLWSRIEPALRWPVVLYGALLFGTAVAAWWADPGCGLGATVFAASDIMIALRLAGIHFPGQGLAIYASYLLGQCLIAGHGAAVMGGD